MIFGPRYQFFIGKGTYGAVVSATNKEDSNKGVAIKKLSKIEDIVRTNFTPSPFASFKDIDKVYLDRREKSPQRDHYHEKS